MGQEEAQGAYSQMVTSLLACKVDGQSLLEAIDRIEKAGKTTDADLRKALVKAAVSDGVSLYQRRDLTQYVAEIKAAQVADVKLGEQMGDALKSVLNGIEDLGPAWPRTAKAPDQALVEAAAARKILVELTTEAAKLTIPGRLVEHLSQRSTGRPFDFNEAFAKDLPDEAVRHAFLKELKEYEGKSFNGVIDPDTGIVYVASPSRLRRRLTIAAPAIFALLVGAVLFGLSKLHIGWALQDSDRVVDGYLLALMGMVVHLLVENVKQLDMAGKIVVVGDKLTWMHLHWVALCTSIVPVAITTVGLIFIGVDDGDWWLTFLAAGYASDSVAGLFLTRYDALAQKSVKTLVAKVKPPPASPAA